MSDPQLPLGGFLVVDGHLLAIVEGRHACPLYAQHYPSHAESRLPHTFCQILRTVSVWLTDFDQIQAWDAVWPTGFGWI